MEVKERARALTVIGLLAVGAAGGIGVAEWAHRPVSPPAIPAPAIPPNTTVRFYPVVTTVDPRIAQDQRLLDELRRQQVAPPTTERLIPPPIVWPTLTP